MNTRRDGCSEDCSEILRILHPVERKKKPRRSLLRGMFKNLLLRGIGLGRHQSHHPLVASGYGQPVEPFTWMNL